MSRFSRATSRVREAWQVLRGTGDKPSTPSGVTPVGAPHGVTPGAGSPPASQSATGGPPGGDAEGPIAVPDELGGSDVGVVANESGGGVAGTAPPRYEEVFVPTAVLVAAAWSWRLLVIGIAVGVGLWLLAYVHLVVVPVVVALLLSALLEPAIRRLRETGVPRSLATATVLITGLGAVVGILTAVVQAFIDGFPDLYGNVQQGVAEIESWLRTSPLGLSQDQVNQGFERSREWLEQNREGFTAGAVNTATQTATTVGHLMAGLFLVLFVSFFFMRDGRTIWTFLSTLFPRPSQVSVYRAGDAAWRTLTSYVRATVVVAFIDGVGIGLAAFLLDLPLWFPIGALVFLASFVPIVGATVSGLVAVLVALVTQGPFTALLMLVAVILVQQIEGHLLQPLLLGRAVALHPVAIVLAIALGVVVAGIVGALISVPLIAVLNTATRSLRESGHSVARSTMAARSGGVP